MKFKKFDQGPREGGNMFLKLDDGEVVKTILRGEIYEFEKDWGKGQGPKKRFKVNAIVSEGGKLHAKIWEFGLGVYGMLGDINDVYPLPETKIQITRRGLGLDTTYVIMPLLKEAPTPQQWEQINAIPLLVLDKPQKEPDPEDSDNWKGL